MKFSLKLTEEQVEKFNTFIAKNQFLFLAIIVVFIGALWRFLGLDSIRQFSPAEVEYLAVTKGPIFHNFSLPLKYLYEATGIYFYAFLAFITRYNVLLLRVLQSFLSIYSIVIFFLFVKSWFNKQVALISGLFFATSASLLVFSRLLLVPILVISLQLSILYVVTIAFRDKNSWLFALASLLTIFGIFLSPIFVISGALIFLACAIVALKNTKLITAYEYQFLIILIPIFIALAVYGYFLPHYFRAVLDYINPGSFGAFYLNIGKNVLSLVAGSQYTGYFAVGSEPILDPFIAVSLGCGIVYAFFHAGKRKHQFLLLWLLFGLLAISLSSTSGIGYLMMILPVCYILAGIVLDYLLTNWARTFPYNKLAQFTMTLFFSIFLFLSIYYNYLNFFYAWENNSNIKQEFTKTIEYKR